MPDGATRPAADRRDPIQDPGVLLLAQRNDLVGNLAGTIAHRFNNLMMAISSYAEVEIKKSGPAQRRNLERLLNDTTRVASLIQKLLALTVSREFCPQVLSVNSVLVGIGSLVEEMAGEHIATALRVDPSIQVVRADVGELEQLMLTLALGARSYLAGTGKIVISTQNTLLEKKSFQPDELSSPGTYVAISVTCAPGALDEQATSQPAGEAGAADLQSQAGAAAREIVRRAGGIFRTSYFGGQCMECTAYLPVCGPAADESQPAPPVRTAVAGNTILVVEDDDAVRVPAAEFLKMEGFKVLQAKNGEEALNVAERHQGQIDVLITDILMPDMNGPEVAQRLAQIYPRLRTLYMSGNSEHTSALGPLQGGLAVLQKPFRLNKLNEQIRELLAN